ncbi:MAG TPA: hypothetical protein PLS50_07460 [Candidatus Dojkabacteria bacterium]|nr:hypothetical protein [Candidatus Dojkabacteria bacterium]
MVEEDRIENKKLKTTLNSPSVDNIKDVLPRIEIFSTNLEKVDVFTTKLMFSIYIGNKLTNTLYDPGAEASIRSINS